jgi:cytochrome oxidase Cu insertion factor (SCO1/SenC/PrrC family)
MKRRELIAFALVVAAALVVGAVLAFSQIRGQDSSPPLTGAGPYRGSEPPGGIRMPEFELRDVVSGEQVRSADLRGRAALITFVDSDCTEQCPLLASAMAEALRRLPRELREETSALAISVNPLVDTRRSVVRFLRQRHAEALTYLVGSVAEMKPVWKRFGVVSAYETGDADTHSADVRIFDPDGVWVSTQHSGVDLSPENLAHDVTQALRS